MLTRAMVQKLMFEGDRVCGVQFEHKGQVQQVTAENEVILSGGAINSPQVLMLSGIGNGAELAKHGVASEIEAPEVGANLQDHANVILQFECKKSFPIHKVNSPARKLAAGLQWVFTHDGVAASNIWEAGGLIRGNDRVSYPNLQYHFGPVGFEYNGTEISLLQAFAIHVDVLRPRSSGAVTLASGDPNDKPLIAFNYYNDPADLEEMVEGVKRTRELIAQAAFDGLRGDELIPGSDVRTDDDIRNWIREASETDFHPCGTCRMGMDENSVVDEELRVRGVRGLRVVDASVFPQITSANLNAQVQMIAAKAADYILGKPQRPPVYLKYSFME